MYDAPKIIIGILIFLVIMTFPIWYNAFSGSDIEVPDPVIKTAGMPGMDTCVKDAAYMKTQHMDLLNKWRDDVVRDNDRVFVADDGRKFNKSLSHTCLDCHSNKADFCDKCHLYMEVDPYCWECHLQTEQMQPKEVE